MKTIWKTIAGKKQKSELNQTQAYLGLGEAFISDKQSQTAIQHNKKHWKLQENNAINSSKHKHILSLEKRTDSTIKIKQQFNSMKKPWKLQ